jgi:hypothetical protein
MRKSAQSGHPDKEIIIPPCKQNVDILLKQRKNCNFGEKLFFY